MINEESILAIDKSDIEEASKKMSKDDIEQLVEWLSLKDDALRYQSLLLLQCRSQYQEDVYPYWDIFREKLKSDNSYQRSIGLTLIADNAKWDKANRLEETMDDYLLLLQDEKPITVRQCIQALLKITPHKNNLNSKISEKLRELRLEDIKETMRKLVLMDILNVLLDIRKTSSDIKIDDYINNALMGEVLDKKAKKQILALL